MIDKAIAKITDEMMEANEPLITMLEEHLTNICTNEIIARKILRENKTLKEASQIIWQEASRRKKGSGAFISDEECCRMAEKYFDINVEDTNEERPKSKVIDLTEFM